MRKRTLFFDLTFAIAGGLLVLFVVLPLAATLFSTTPQEFLASLEDPELIHSLALTFISAVIATLLATATGMPLAYLLARRKFHGKRLLEALVNLPIVIPHTAAGVALLLVFGRRGILGQAFAGIGLTFTDNLGGIVVAMLFVSMPFLVNLSREAFAMTDEELERVAFTDGASPWQAFWRVTLPQAWRGVLAGAVMMWARGISEFGAVVILAYNPKIVPVLIYELYEGFGLKAAEPAALLLILVALVVFVLLRLALLPENE